MTNLLTLLLVSIGVAIIFALPWILIYETLFGREKADYQAMQSIWIMFPMSVFMCLLEISLIVDWIMGW